MLSTPLVPHIMTLPHLISSIPLASIVYVLIGMLVVMAVWTARLEFRIKRLTRGKSGHDLESAITEMQNGQQELERFRSEVETYLTQVEHRLARSVRDVKTVRFNPFKGKGMGGNQSFATALINENGDGVILSSLYARDHVSVFAKPIAKYQSEHELTEEEQAVLSEAQNSFSTSHT